MFSSYHFLWRIIIFGKAISVKFSVVALLAVGYVKYFLTLMYTSKENRKLQMRMTKPTRKLFIVPVFMRGLVC